MRTDGPFRDDLPHAVIVDLELPELARPGSRRRVFGLLGRPVRAAGALALLIAIVAIGLLATVVSPSDRVDLSHFDRDGLAFDYPASWSASRSGANLEFGTVLDLLGSVPALSGCGVETPDQSEPSAVATNCGIDQQVGPGQVLVTLSRDYGPGVAGPIDPNDPDGIGIGQRYVMVAGLPAIFIDYPEHAIGSPDIVLRWEMPIPGDPTGRYGFTARMQEPGADQLRAQVQAVVATMRFDPPVPALDPSDGPRIAAIGLRQLLDSDPTLACFSGGPGSTATATITALPWLDGPLSKPLPVTCSVQIEPNVIGVWKMTLTESWTAAGDRSAGRYTIVSWLTSAGMPGVTGQDQLGPIDIPYSP